MEGDGILAEKSLIFDQCEPAAVALTIIKQTSRVLLLCWFSSGYYYYYYYFFLLFVSS
jgi:hypothetical protein